MKNDILETLKDWERVFDGDVAIELYSDGSGHVYASHVVGDEMGVYPFDTLEEFFEMNPAEVTVEAE